MANTFKKLAQVQPGTAAAVVYTAPAATQVVVKEIRAVNATTGTAATVGLFHGGSAAANRIWPDIPLNPGEQAIEDATMMLAPGDTIVAIASVAAAITLTIYGVEMV